jgi:hypothetical protein
MRHFQERVAQRGKIETGGIGFAESDGLGET